MGPKKILLNDLSQERKMIDRLSFAKLFDSFSKDLGFLSELKEIDQEMRLLSPPMIVSKNTESFLADTRDITFSFPVIIKTQCAVPEIN